LIDVTFALFRCLLLGCFEVYAWHVRAQNLPLMRFWVLIVEAELRKK